MIKPLARSVLALSLVTCSSLLACSSSSSGGTPPPPDALAQAKAANMKYTDVNAAMADGYVQLTPCLIAGKSESPQGVMGIHFANMNYLMQPLNPDKPVILLYVPDSSGALKLVGFEYLAFIMQDGKPYIGDGPNVPTNPPRQDSIAAAEQTTLFGQQFGQPQPGHGPGMPWHVHLHVFAYVDNPAGMFSPYNPALTCGNQPGVPDDVPPPMGDGGMMMMDGGTD